jgi:formate hydrogenlyase subunit 3/multisubunit Na+/H+ antiporter MnhD subunit
MSLNPIQAPGGGSKLMRNLVLVSNCANFLALIVTTGLSYAMHQAGRPTAVIGKVPRGFHAFLPWDSLGVTSAVLPRACLLAVISFMLTYSGQTRPTPFHFSSPGSPCLAVPCRA